MSRESNELKADIDRINQPHKKTRKQEEVDVTDLKFPSTLGQLQKSGVTIVSKIAEDVRGRQDSLPHQSVEKAPVTREDLSERLYPDGRPSIKDESIKSTPKQPKEETIETTKTEPAHQDVLNKSKPSEDNPKKSPKPQIGKTEPVTQDPLDELMPPQKPVVPMPDDESKEKKPLRITPKERSEAWGISMRRGTNPDRFSDKLHGED